MDKNKHYFDADALIRKIYNKIAVWHNNDARLSDADLGIELRLLSKEIAEDVLISVHGDATQIRLDRHKLGMTEREIKEDDKERDERRSNIAEKVDQEAKKKDDTPAT